MRGGRFGSKAGRVAVVVALVFGVLFAGTSVASASEVTGTSGASASLGKIAADAIQLEPTWE
jgi:hypothetical protein